MKLTLEINNQTSQKFSHKKILQVFECTLKLAELTCIEKKSVELSMAVLDTEEIQKLNSQYRQKQKPTDVLSFCEFENTEELCNEKSSHIFLGELIFCPEVILKNAKEDKESFEYALTYIVAHGILHLMGFDHGEKMFALQKNVADQLLKQE